MRQFHFNEANPPDSRHTVSYIEYHPSLNRHWLHTLVYMLFYPLQIALNGRGESRFFFAPSQPSVGVKGTMFLLTTHSMTRSRPTGPPTFGGPPLFKVLGHIGGQFQIAFLVIGSSSFIFVPCF